MLLHTHLAKIFLRTKGRTPCHSPLRPFPALEKYMEIRYKKRLQQRQLPSRQLYHRIRHFHLSKNQNTKCFRFSWYRQNNLPKAKRSLSSIKQCYGLSSKEIKFSSPSKRAHKELSLSKANQSVRFTPIARSRQSDCLSILSPTKGGDIVLPLLPFPALEKCIWKAKRRDRSGVGAPPFPSLLSFSTMETGIAIL